MFATLTSQIKASLQGNSQQLHAPPPPPQQQQQYIPQQPQPQYTPQYVPTPQQPYQNFPPQVPAPWMTQWSSTDNCWFYVNNQTGQSSWVNPLQIQPQPNNGYQAPSISSPPQHNQFYPPYNPTSFSAPAPQQQQPQTQRGYQSSPMQSPPQYIPQTYNQGYLPPPQQGGFQRPQQGGFQRPQAQQHQYQGKPQAPAPNPQKSAKKSHTGRKIALGLGALVAGVVGVDMLMDSDNDGDDGDSSGGGWFSSGNDSTGDNSGGGDFSNGNDSSSAATYNDTTVSYPDNSADYSTPSYGGDASGSGAGGGTSYDNSGGSYDDALADEYNAAIASQSVANGFACQDAANF